jgi:hypothetical protein
MSIGQRLGAVFVALFAVAFTTAVAKKYCKCITTAAADSSTLNSHGLSCG